MKRFSVASSVSSSSSSSSPYVSIGVASHGDTAKTTGEDTGLKQAIISMVLMFVASWLLSFFLMPLEMTTVNRTFSVGKFYMSLYMTFMMVAAESLVMLLLWFVGVMQHMHYNVRVFTSIMFVVGIVGTLVVRQGLIVPQVGVSTVNFSRAMIEHHENAIFMAGKLLLRTTDTSIPAELLELAVNITTTQASEIDFMRQFA